MVGSILIPADLCLRHATNDPGLSIGSVSSLDICRFFPTQQTRSPTRKRHQKPDLNDKMNNEEYPNMDVVDVGRPSRLVNAPAADVSVFVEQFPNFPNCDPYLRHDSIHYSADLFPIPLHDHPWSILGPLDPSMDFNPLPDGDIGSHLPPASTYQGPVTHPPPGSVYIPEFDVIAIDPGAQLADTLPQSMNRPVELGVLISLWPVTFSPSRITDVLPLGVSPLAFPIHFEEQQMQHGRVGDDADGFQQGIQDLSISTYSRNLETVEDISPSHDMAMAVQSDEAGVCGTGPVPDPSDPWEMIRAKFIQLYIGEAKTLETAVLALKHAYGFHAS